MHTKHVRARTHTHTHRTLSLFLSDRQTDTQTRARKHAQAHTTVTCTNSVWEKKAKTGAFSTHAFLIMTSFPEEANLALPVSALLAGNPMTTPSFITTTHT